MDANTTEKDDTSPIEEVRPVFFMGEDILVKPGLPQNEHYLEEMRKLTVGICAMSKKSNSKPMNEILTRLKKYMQLNTLIFDEDVILNSPVEDWPVVDVLISFFSAGFPLEKAIAYKNLRKPFVVNDLESQFTLLDRREVYKTLMKNGIPHPRYSVLNRDQGKAPTSYTITDNEDSIEIESQLFHKPFVEKPVSAEDHNVYIYFPAAAGGGSQRLFRKMYVRLILWAVVTLPYFVILTSGAVDGSWGPWTNYRSCSLSCGEGTQIRNRTCDDPEPSNGGAACQGANNDTIVCNDGMCPNISISWSSWSNFSSCSASCGDGYKVRNRTCQRLDIENEAVDCNGTEIENIPCNEGSCPAVNGSWGAWSNYSSCSVSCGGGSQSRIRICDSPKPEYGGLFCVGSYIETRPCNENDCPGMDNKGRTFIIGFMPNVQGGIQLILFITTEYDTDIKVKVTTPLFDKTFAKTVVVRKSVVGKIPINTLMMGGLGSIEKKGILIEAEKDVVVYAVNKRYASTDAFLVLPVDALGQEYYVSSWGQSSAFMIIGTEDQTDISVKLGSASPSITIDGNVYGPKTSVKFQLNKFQTMYVISNWGDFTGTHVYGTKPVSLLGGSYCAKIGNGACDHIVQQMLPLERLGTDFVTIGMPNCNAPDTFRIVASQGNTVVNISGRASYTLYEPGDFYTFDIPDGESKTISSNKAIQVILYANGGCDNKDNGDPAMIILPSIQQFSSDYTFSTVKLDNGDFINSLSLVIAENYIPGLRLDNRILPHTSWKSVQGRNDIKYTDFVISSGAHTVYHMDPSVTFLAISTGIQEYNSYGYPAGFNFVPMTNNCPNSASNNRHKKKDESTCDFGLDPCSDSPCLNHGTCVAQGWTNFECVCPTGFSGQRCEIDLCKPHPSDVVFLIDGSRSMGAFYFEMQKKIIKELMSNWTIDEEHFQIAIISFSSIATVEYDFGIINNNTALEDKISKVQYQGQSSQIHKGVAVGVKLLSNRTRQVYYANVKKYLIVISDGLPSSPRDVTQFISKDTIMHAIALGEDVSHYYLHKLTGTMDNVFPPKTEPLWHQMMSELIHPVCDLCHSSDKTDLIVMVDTSRDMDKYDMLKRVPSITNKLLAKIGTNRTDTRISLITFDRDISIRFKLKRYSNETSFRMQIDMSSFSESTYEVSNFTEILSDVSTLLFDSGFGSRSAAKKILLVISQFKFSVGSSNLYNLLNDSIEVYTIGLDSNDISFNNMLEIASSSFHVGTVGDTFANLIDTFVSAFVRHLSYVKCLIV